MKITFVNYILNMYVLIYYVISCTYNILIITGYVAYRICCNFRGVKLSRITNFRSFRVFISAVCDVIAQALPVCLNFRGMKLSRMAIDPRKPQKFNPAKVKAYTVIIILLCI